ncbi:hypothetical protein ACOI1C_13560 [Bacillus sp. DJP31]|uniref:hypothetical protein n=1 Tax=Bacillus sp. DJP31 TaxID=3409789 RepID=UPI003BB7993F
MRLLLDSKTDVQRKKYGELLQELKHATTVKEVRLIAAGIHKLLDEIEEVNE